MLIGDGLICNEVGGRRLAIVRYYTPYRTECRSAGLADLKIFCLEVEWCPPDVRLGEEQMIGSPAGVHMRAEISAEHTMCRSPGW